MMEAPSKFSTYFFGEGLLKIRFRVVKHDVFFSPVFVIRLYGGHGHIANPVDP